MSRFLCITGLLLAGSVVRGDPPPGVKSIRVVLHPALPPLPALRYPLLPELRYQTPGNAVPLYRKARMGMKDAIAALDDPRWNERVDRWLEMPLDRLPRARVLAFLRPFDAPLHMVESAARHEYADWELTDRLRKTGIGTAVPEIQDMREFATILGIRLRLALAEGRRDDAVRDLQTIFAVAHHLNRSPVVISALVSIGITNIAAQRLEEIIQQPAAPNFYWSLTDLPTPFVDLRPGMQGERIASYGTFRSLPTAPSADVPPLTPEQTKAYAGLLIGLRREEVPIPDGAYQALMALDIQRKHEKAKQTLVEAGWARTVVEKMPHLEVAVLRGLLDYERQMDDSIKWTNLPYWQAAPALMKLATQRAKFRFVPGPDEPAIPVAEFLMANTGRVLFSRTRLERKLAVLRCLEAIRLYAAEHDAKLPASLDQVTEVPIPVDPFTGKPFDYMSGASAATLYAAALAPPIPGRKPLPQDALYYEIALKK